MTKQNVSFSRYWDYCISDDFTNFNIFEVIIYILVVAKLTKIPKLFLSLLSLSRFLKFSTYWQCNATYQFLGVVYMRDGTRRFLPRIVFGCLCTHLEKEETITSFWQQLFKQLLQVAKQGLDLGPSPQNYANIFLIFLFMITWYLAMFRCLYC